MHLATPGVGADMPCSVVDATPELIAQLLAKSLRPQERHNWVDATDGRNIGMILRQMRKQDPNARIKALLTEQTGCVCLWAVTPSVGWGHLWLLTSLEAERLEPDVSAYLAADIDAIHEQYGSLLAHAHSEDALLIRWLETVGFSPSGTADEKALITFVKRMPD